MKPSFFLLLGASALTLAGDTNPISGPVRGLGRYRLFSGKSERIGKGGSTIHDNIFKIDSVTGRTWRYGMAIDGSNITEVFYEVRDHNLPDLRPVAEDFLTQTNK